MAKKKETEKTELTEADKFFIIEKRKEVTEDELAKILKVEKKVVVTFLEEWVRLSVRKPEMSDYASNRKGSVALTRQAAEAGDESEKYFHNMPSKYTKDIHIIPKKDK